MDLPLLVCDGERAEFAILSYARSAEPLGGFPFAEF